MKTLILKPGIKTNLLLWIFLFIFSATSFAQPGRGYNKQGPPSDDRSGYDVPKCDILNLSDEQEKKINDLRTAHLKEMIPVNNNLKLKAAELRILTTADKIDQKAIDKKIDEIYLLKAEKARKAEAHRQAVRAMLTDDQKVIFDSKLHGKGPKGNPGCPGGGTYSNCPRK